MRITMLLCDAAEVADGKLFILGGGWSVTTPGTPSAIALKLDVPWDQTNQPLNVVLRLVREDGQQVMQQGPIGSVPIEVRAQVEVGRPPGLKQGTPIDFPLAVSIPPLPLDPGTRYSWELSVNKRVQDDWHLAFSTRAAAEPPTSPTNLPPGE